MAEETDEAPQVEEEVLELTEEVEAPEVAEETETQPEAVDDEEVIVSFGDEAAPASEEAPEWVKELRKQYREVVKENEALKKQIVPPTPKAGPKPTQWDDGIDGDEEIYAQKLIEWHEAVKAEEAVKTEAQKAQEEAARKYQAKVEAYGEQKQTLGVKDFTEAEAEVLSSLNDVQKQILIHGAENKAKLVYALGKHPEKLRQLASISDPIEFAFAAARLEGQTKMERRRPATNPESRVSGAAQLSQSDNRLSDKLSAEEWARRRNEQIRQKRR
jgi:hypothetical protein